MISTGLSTYNLLSQVKNDFKINELKTITNNIIKLASNSSSLLPTYDPTKSNKYSMLDVDKQTEEANVFLYEYMGLLKSKLSSLITKLTNALTMDLDMAMSNTTVCAPLACTGPAMQGYGAVNPGAARSSLVFFNLWGNSRVQDSPDANNGYEVMPYVETTVFSDIIDNNSSSNWTATGLWKLDEDTRVNENKVWYFGQTSGNYIKTYQTAPYTPERIDVIAEWEPDYDYDMHIVEADGTKIGYGEIFTGNGVLNRDDTRGTQRTMAGFSVLDPTNPSYDDYADEWYFVKNPYKHSTIIPLATGTYTVYIDDWKNSGAGHNLKVAVITDAGTKHGEVILTKNTFSFTPGAGYAGKPRATVGTFTIGNSARVQGSLTSKKIDLETGSIEAILSFEHWFQTETQAPSNFDLKYIEYSKDGTNFTPLATITSSSKDWGYNSYTIPLSAADDQLYIRFRFDSIDGKFNSFPGWKINNVKVRQKKPSNITDRSAVVGMNANIYLTLPSGTKVPVSAGTTSLQNSIEFTNDGKINYLDSLFVNLNVHQEPSGGYTAKLWTNDSQNVVQLDSNITGPNLNSFTKFLRKSGNPNIEPYSPDSSDPNKYTALDISTAEKGRRNILNKFEAVLATHFSRREYKDMLRFGLLDNVIIAATSTTATSSQVFAQIRLQGRRDISVSGNGFGYIDIFLDKWSAYYHS